MAIRMQPVRSVFARMPRLVRDISAKLGKKVRLVTSGDQTEVDKTVIEELADPITHMIRNAIDHGVEDAATRLAAGKPEDGDYRAFGIAARRKHSHHYRRRWRGPRSSENPAKRCRKGRCTQRRQAQRRRDLQPHLRARLFDSGQGHGSLRARRRYGRGPPQYFGHWRAHPDPIHAGKRHALHAGHSAHAGGARRHARCRWRGEIHSAAHKYCRKHPPRAAPCAHPHRRHTGGRGPGRVYPADFARPRPRRSRCSCGTLEGAGGRCRSRKRLQDRPCRRRADRPAAGCGQEPARQLRRRPLHLRSDHPRHRTGGAHPRHRRSLRDAQRLCRALKRTQRFAAGGWRWGGRGNARPARHGRTYRRHRKSMHKLKIYSRWRRP